MSPKNIFVNKEKNVLKLEFDNSMAELSAEMLRVYSPSAEVQGHSPEQRKVVGGKKEVKIIGIESVGNYAIRITFDDGHDTGIFSWGFLADFEENKQKYREQYIAELEENNLAREA